MLEADVCLTAPKSKNQHMVKANFSDSESGYNLKLWQIQDKH